MNFIEATKHALNGSKIRRKIWSDKDLYICSDLEYDELSCLKWRDKSIDISIDSILSDDWEIYDEVKYLKIEKLSNLKEGTKFKFVNDLNTSNVFIKCSSLLTDRYCFVQQNNPYRVLLKKIDHDVILIT